MALLHFIRPLVHTHAPRLMLKQHTLFVLNSKSLVTCVSCHHLRKLSSFEKDSSFFYRAKVKLRGTMQKHSSDVGHFSVSRMHLNIDE